MEKMKGSAIVTDEDVPEHIREKRTLITIYYT